MDCKHNAYIETAQGRKCLLCGALIEEKPVEKPVKKPTKKEKTK